MEVIKVNGTTLFTLEGVDLSFLMQSVSEFVVTALILVLLFIAGYVLGYFVSRVLRRILLIERIQVTLVKSGATTTSMWKSIVEFSTQYTTWLLVFFVLTLAEEKVPITVTFFNEFIVPLTVFIALVIIGLLIGGFLGKLTKDTLVTIGLEEGLTKYKIADTLGGVPISSILSTIVKWYVFLLFVSQAVEKLLSETAILTETMRSLMSYVPNAILGLLVLLVSLVIAEFAANRIRVRKVSFGEVFAIAIEIVIVFFGVILALPRLFNIDDPEVFQTSLGVMTQSFQILIVGVALGLAIAIGLGLKDSIVKVGGKLKEGTG
ncbi:MAG: hypothetical protein DRO89_01540 [Candidatus Altiarchaeales archaeon]|nr:MAG: hypothetical protein DRO89_01540 [Candidatus Altiarchaeales archaeon]